MVLFLAPSAIGEIGHYIGYREENRHRTMVALLLAPLASALRLFRDWLCRDVALETSQRSSPQQGVQVVDGCGRLHWLLGHVSSDNFDGILSGAFE